MLLTIDELKDFTVRAVNGDVGKVVDLYFDDATWNVRYLVVDTGTWLAGRVVLLSPESFARPLWEEQVLPISLTQAQVENSPTVDLDRPVSRQRMVELHEHYGWSNFGANGELHDLPPTGGFPEEMPTTLGDRDIGLEKGPFKRERHGDPNLRSAEEIKGYDVRAVDEDAGHVEDIVVGLDPWTVRYVLVDTRDWLPGRKLPVPPQRVTGIDATKEHCLVNLTREQIEQSPAYEGDELFQAAYERKVHGYYGALEAEG